MPRQPDFISQLERNELEQLEAFARKPGRTIDQCFDYLCAEHGFVPSEEFPEHPRRLNRNSVWRWKRRFDEADRMSVASELADAMATAEDEAGAVDLGRGARLMVLQRLVNQIAEMGDDANISVLNKFSTTLEKLTRTGRHSVKLEGELIELKNQQADAVRAAEAAAKSGKSATDVVSTIKQALGITA